MHCSFSSLLPSFSWFASLCLWNSSTNDYSLLFYYCTVFHCINIYTFFFYLFHCQLKIGLVFSWGLLLMIFLWMFLLSSDTQMHVHRRGTGGWSVYIFNLQTASLTGCIHLHSQFQWIRVPIHAKCMWVSLLTFSSMFGIVRLYFRCLMSV